MKEFQLLDTLLTISKYSVPSLGKSDVSINFSKYTQMASDKRNIYLTIVAGRAKRKLSQAIHTAWDSLKLQ